MNYELVEFGCVLVVEASLLEVGLKGNLGTAYFDTNQCPSTEPG